MAGTRMSRRKIREVLRLTHELGLTVRQVREATGVGKTAVSEYVSRAKVVGITWPIPPEITDADLERRLFTPAGFHDGSTKPVPDWTKVHQELKRRGVTLMILWEEHRAEHVEGNGYSRFCEVYGEWRRLLAPTMRQTHVAGDKLFVDWAGDTVPIIDAMTGEVHEAHLFVAALGASSYTYAEARWSETLPDWIGAHVNAFDFLGGVPKAAVPDYVSGHIIGLMCRSALCGREADLSRRRRAVGTTRPHNLQSDESQFSKAASSPHTGLRGKAAEAATGGSQACSAASFERMLISA